jgi:hypothetical protein
MTGPSQPEPASSPTTDSAGPVYLQVKALPIFRPPNQPSRNLEGDDKFSAPLSGRSDQCARAGCGNPLPPQTGPGRPRRFCSELCRRSSSREVRTGVRGVSRESQARKSTPFGDAIRAAIDQAGLSLGEISEIAATFDRVELPPATVSNWQNGRTPLPGPDRDRKIHALERILGLSRGELLLLLAQVAPNRAPAAPQQPLRPPAAPHHQLVALRESVGRLGGVDGYVTTVVKERFVVARDHRHLYRLVQQTIRATSDFTDCYWLFASAEDEDAEVKVRPVPPCRVGRRVQHGPLIAAELLFDKTLRRGETHTFEFRLDCQQVPHPQPFVRRWTSPPGQPCLDSLELAVRFEAAPRQVWECEWPTEHGDPIDLRLAPLNGDTVHLTRTHPVPGLVGLRWSW